MSTISASKVLADLNLLTLLSLKNGYSLQKTTSVLHRCSPNKQVRNILSFSILGPALDIEKVTASAAKSYLGILDGIAELACCDLPFVRNTIFGPKRSKLLRSLFNVERDANGLSEFKSSVVKQVFKRLDEIAESYDIPWDDVARRLRCANGHTSINALFCGPEADAEGRRTLSDILAGLDRKKPKLRPYQKKIVQSFEDTYADRSRMHVIRLPTGAGKTQIANTCVDNYLSENESSKVLWLAPNWELLRQAAVNMARYFDRESQLRFGGNRHFFLGLEKFSQNDKDAKVIYSTVHSWHHGGKKLFPKDLDQLMVVYDESHWGLGSKMLNRIFKHYIGKATMLGLSATPRESKRSQILKPSYTYAQLLKKGYLANPVVEQIDTGMSWQPAFSQTQVFTPLCLADLGDNEARNRLVVDKLVQRQNEFGKVLVFACNTRHADTLDLMLRKANVSSAAYHCGVDRTLRADRLRKFADGAIQFLVSVNMAVHGIDIPDINCIVLARPTESAALCSQMVGRGARRPKGKDDFHILEFTDNVQRHADRIFHSASLFQTVIAGGGSGPGRAPLPFHLEPDAVHMQQLTGIAGVEGLQYTVDHTFGVEIELTAIPGALWETIPDIDSMEWHSVAKRIIACVRAAGIDMSEEPTEYHEGDPMRWRVEQDISCGWEIISPPLRNQAGFSELHKVLGGIRNCIEGSRELMLDPSCGLHVTLSTKLKDKAKLSGFLRRVQRLEPGLFTLVKPSRLFKNDRHNYSIKNCNPYCRPVRSCTVDTEDFDPCFTDRCSSVNIRKVPQSDYNLIEVRLHHGSVDYLEIIPWISLWMHIFNSARIDSSGDGIVGKVFPRGNTYINGAQIEKEDIIKLLADESIGANNRLKSTLILKRKAMRRFWENVLPERLEAWEDAGWYN